MTGQDVLKCNGDPPGFEWRHINDTIGELNGDVAKCMVTGVDVRRRLPAFCGNKPCIPGGQMAPLICL